MTVSSESISIDWNLLRSHTIEDETQNRLPDSETQERAWIRRARNNDPKALRSLVVAHQDKVFHLCYRWLGNAEDAREACQDVFLRAFKNLSGYRNKGKFSTWLYQIALNRCRDHRKTRWFKLSSLSDPIEECHAGIEDIRDCPDDIMVRQDDISKIRRGLACVAERHRTVLILIHLELLSPQDCAAVLKCTTRAVEGRLYRAHQALQAWWDTQPV